MKKEDLYYLQDLLMRVKNPDARILRARAIVDRDIAIYQAKLDRLYKTATYDNELFL